MCIYLSYYFIPSSFFYYFLDIIPSLNADVAKWCKTPSNSNDTPNKANNIKRVLKTTKHKIPTYP